MNDERLRVLFLCTGNSARSQMAEALLRHLSRDRIAVFSAGTNPQPAIHTLAKATLEERFNIDTSHLFPKSMNRFLDERFDYVITVCDRASERCPVFPSDPEKIHWNFEDPAAIQGDEATRRRAFEAVANGLAGRLRIWIALPGIRTRMDAAEEALAASH